MSTEPNRLSKKAHAAIQRARQETGICVATISLLELARLAVKGQIVLSASIESVIKELVTRVIVKPMTPEIVANSVRFPATFPKDPADRIIASTALTENMPLITADTAIRRSQVVITIW